MCSRHNMHSLHTLYTTRYRRVCHRRTHRRCLVFGEGVYVLQKRSAGLSCIAQGA